MTNNARVLNVTRGFTLKHSQAVKAVTNCAAAWVEFGVSIRQLTPAESIAARHQQIREHEALPSAEIPGIRFEPPAYATESYRRECELSLAAGRLIQEMA